MPQIIAPIALLWRSMAYFLKTINMCQYVRRSSDFNYDFTYHKRTKKIV